MWSWGNFREALTMLTLSWEIAKYSQKLRKVQVGKSRVAFVTVGPGPHLRREPQLARGWWDWGKVSLLWSFTFTSIFFFFRKRLLSYRCWSDLLPFPNCLSWAFAAKQRNGTEQLDSLVIFIQFKNMNALILVFYECPVINTIHVHCKNFGNE